FSASFYCNLIATSSAILAPLLQRETTRPHEITGTVSYLRGCCRCLREWRCAGFCAVGPTAKLRCAWHHRAVDCYEPAAVRGSVRDSQISLRPRRLVQCHLHQ